MIPRGGSSLLDSEESTLDQTRAARHTPSEHKYERSATAMRVAAPMLMLRTAVGVACSVIK